MKWLVALAMLAAVGATPAQRPPVPIRWVKHLPQTDHDRVGKRLATIIAQHGFHGEYAVAKVGDSWDVDMIVRGEPTGMLRTDADLRRLSAPRLWRWASVTKQVVAVLVMQEVAAGRIDLDQPLSTYVPRFASPNAGQITVRMLLRHQSGLPNPDDTAVTPDAVPAYDAPGYAGSRDPLTGFCAGPVKGRAGGAWSYNNCDYIVAGALLKAVTGRSWHGLVAERIARPLGLASVGAFPTDSTTTPGTDKGRPEPRYDLAAFGAAAGLYGTAADLLAFDRALMAGRLLPASALATMWDGQPQLGSIALGQWVFVARLTGCAGPVRIVERHGQIGGVQVRNLLLPDRNVAVVAFTDRAEFDFGEVWQGKGFAYDLLSAAACP